MSLRIKAGGSLYPTSQETLDQQLAQSCFKKEKLFLNTPYLKWLNAAEEVIKRNQFKRGRNQLDYVVPHQANKTNHRCYCKAIKSQGRKSIDEY